MRRPVVASGAPVSHPITRTRTHTHTHSRSLPRLLLIIGRRPVAVAGAIQFDQQRTKAKRLDRSTPRPSNSHHNRCARPQPLFTSWASTQARRTLCGPATTALTRRLCAEPPAPATFVASSLSRPFASSLLMPLAVFDSPPDQSEAPKKRARRLSLLQRLIPLPIRFAQALAGSIDRSIPKAPRVVRGR